MIKTWIVYLLAPDGVALDRAEVPVADGAVDVTIDPTELFANGTHGADRIAIRMHDGSVTHWPIGSGAWRQRRFRPEDLRSEQNENAPPR